jgi:quinol monooxygenase YgiN
MIVLIAHYYCKAGESDFVLEQLKKMKPLVEANEPGCTFYQVSRSQDNRDHLLLYEHYTDQAALLGHRDTPHFQEIIEGQIIPRLEKRERELYTLEIG